MSRQSNRRSSSFKSDSELQPHLDNLLTLMRLVVGGTLEGTDEIMRRLKEHQAEVKRSQVVNLPIYSTAESDAERLRHALVGLLFEAPEVVARNLSKMQADTQRATERVSKLTRPITNSWFARPFKRQIEKVSARGEAFVDRLAHIGRIEAQNGRLLARATTAEALDEILGYLAEKPEIRQLVQQQGLSLTEEVVNALRKRTAEADNLIDRITRRQRVDPPPVVDASAVALPDSDPTRQP